MKRILIWFLAASIWGSALWCGSRILRQSEYISMQLEGEDAGITRLALELMQEKYDAAAYVKAEMMTVTVPETGRKDETPAFRFVGDSRLITGGWPAAGGFGQGDPGECMISRASAVRLFGSSEAAGLVVLADGQEWYVRGVFDSGQPAILLPADRETLLTGLDFRFTGAGDHQADAEQACYQYGVTGEIKAIDYGFFGAVARLFLWTPFLIMLLHLKIVKKRLASADGRKVLYYGLEIAFWIGMLLFLFQAFRFPPGYIPAKWSDFGFWAVKGQESAESVNILLTSTQMKARLFRNQLAACTSLSVAAGLLWHKAISGLYSSGR